MTIVETCHDPTNQVTLYIFTVESRVVSAVLTKDVLFVLVGSEPGDCCCSGLFGFFIIILLLPTDNVQRVYIAKNDSWKHVTTLSTK